VFVQIVRHCERLRTVHGVDFASENVRGPWLKVYGEVVFSSTWGKAFGFLFGEDPPMLVVFFRDGCQFVRGDSGVGGS
jgi:hypothetical protein